MSLSSIRLLIKRTASSSTRYLGQPWHGSHPTLVRKDETTPGISQSEYADRRASLFTAIVHTCRESSSSAASDRCILLLRAANVTYSAPDVPHPFRQCANFYYLTGLQEPNACIAIAGTSADPQTTLFVAERDAHAELWQGPSAGIDGTRLMTGVDRVLDRAELPRFLDQHLRDRYAPVFEPTQFVDDHDIGLLLAEHGRVPDVNLIESIHRLRWIKSSAECRLMRETCRIGSAALASTMIHSRPDMNENELVGRMEFEVRARGARSLAYPPVVAGGQRALIIHYLNADQTICAGDLVLMDAGCDLHGYVSDITRTWPIDGEFSQAQMELYESLNDAQQKLLTYVANHRPLMLNKLHMLMLKELGHNLQMIGVFPKNLSDDELKYKTDQICPHHVSHYLGLDVHDTPTVSRSIPLSSGVVITVEPGIYLKPDDRTIPARFRGIGLRIEDDVLITDTGCELLTEQCPKDTSQLRALAMQMNTKRHTDKM